MHLNIVVLCSFGLGYGTTVLADPTGFIDQFKSLGAEWHIADYDFGHPMFDTDWNKTQVSIKAGLELKLSPQTGARNRFAGSSIRREKASHFGRYEASIRPARGEGLVTGFFTYSGPYYGTRHDEIDIEFLGKNTRQMHVAWFVDGQLRNRFIDLGFDAADKLNKYAFEWHPDKLCWYARDKLLFEHNYQDGPVPDVPGRLFFNLWAADPSIANWAGLAEDKLSGVALVENVSFAPFSIEDAKSKAGC